jgi:hypothetical protein
MIGMGRPQVTELSSQFELVHCLAHPEWKSILACVSDKSYLSTV